MPHKNGSFKCAVLQVQGRGFAQAKLALKSKSSVAIIARLNEREVLFVFAIIETGGKQYKVTEQDIIFVEKLDCAENDEIVFDKVVALSTEAGFKAGTPTVEGAVVKGTVVKNGKGKKIYVLKYKSKKDSKKKIGHRQPYTKVQITSIVG
jgi:large subunit ribosomal protein L21